MTVAYASLSAIARLVRAVIPAAGIALAIASLFALPAMTAPGSGSYPGAAMIQVALGSALVGAGLLAWLDRAIRLQGAATILLGIVVVAPAWEAWIEVPAIVRSVAMVVQPFLLPLVGVVVALALVRRPWGIPIRLVLGVAFVAAGVTAIGAASLRDPFLDPACFVQCRYNVFLVTARPEVARGLAVAWTVASSVIGLGIIALAVRAVRSSTRATLARRWPTLVAAGILGVQSLLAAAMILQRPAVRPPDPPPGALVWLQAVGLGLLALAVGARALRRRRVRNAVARLRVQLGAAPTPGTLAAELARATGDPTLTVAYPLAGADRWADATGRSVPRPVAGEGRAVTPILLRGRPIADIEHDAATLDVDELRQELGAAARLAIENERLRAEVLAQLVDLRASRARVVETGDAERRRLERDLHDGAQQRLLALGYDLRLARSAALAGGDPDVISLLESAMAETDAGVSDLRGLAHGIYPAILSEAGLEPAVWSLTDESAVTVDIIEVSTERFASAIERTAFEVVAEGIGAVPASRTAPVRVRIAHEASQLVVEVDGTGDGPFTYLADRVGALGGQLTHLASGIRAEIPCASS